MSVRGARAYQKGFDKARARIGDAGSKPAVGPGSPGHSKSGDRAYWRGFNKAQKRQRAQADVNRRVAPGADMRGRVGFFRRVGGTSSRFSGGRSESASYTPTRMGKAITEQVGTGLSYDQIRQKLGALLNPPAAEGDTAPAGPRAWVEDMYDGTVIYSYGGTYFARDFTLEGEDVAWGADAPIEVERVMTWEPIDSSAEDAEESAEPTLTSDLIPLFEAASAKDGTIPVKLIQPGWGSSGYYSSEVLKRDGAKAFPAGTHMYIDHPTKAEEKDRPERSLRDLAAVFKEDPKWSDEGPTLKDGTKAGPGLYTRAETVGAYREVLPQLAPYIGVSIRALGRAAPGEAEGRKGQIVQELAHGRSVDFVTKAGAGGAVVPILEAARTHAPVRASTTIRAEEAREGDMPEQTEAQKQLEEARQETRRLQEQLVMRDARDIVTEALGKSDLPKISHARITEAMVAQPPVKDGKLDREAFTTAIAEKIKGEREYIASLRGSGQVRGLGEATATNAEGNAETTLSESLQSLFGTKKETADRVAAIGSGRA